ncbi:MAG: hypothetical protein V4658_06595, partial [Bacteroidota bacterium]
MFRLFKPIGIIVSGFIFFSACKVNKNGTSSNSSSQNAATKATPAKPVKKAPYHAAETRLLDVQHMDLAIRFDY